MTTKHEVIALHAASPHLTAAQMAEQLGCAVEYVRATAQRNNLALGAVHPAQNDPKALRAMAKVKRQQARKLIRRAQKLEKGISEKEAT